MLNTSIVVVKADLAQGSVLRFHMYMIVRSTNTASVINHTRQKNTRKMLKKNTVLNNNFCLFYLFFSYILNFFKIDSFI